MHIKQKYLYALLCCICLIFTGCNKDETKKDYEGVGKLIASRNSARYKKAEQAKQRIKKKEPPKVQKGEPAEKSVESQKKKPEKKKFSSEIFYEEEIKIISASSDNTLGIGTAYLNKNGKIVQIKIKRD